MKAIDLNQMAYVTGGEVGATGMGDDLSYRGYTDAQAVSCANTMMAWGGLGGLIGGFVGGLSAGLGTLAGGAAAASYSNSCRIVRIQ